MILLFAYACEPERGSEPAVGWAWAEVLSQFAQVRVVTRENNREAIERARERDRSSRRVEFFYVDLDPRWRRWKKGQRGIRLYYFLWQLKALRAARKMMAAERIDLVWHVTLANAWLGSTAALLGRPFVYGPVGGGVSMPWQLARAVGTRGLTYEIARALARSIGRYANPLARLAWRRASVIFVQNNETRSWLPSRHRPKAYVLPNVIVAASPAKATETTAGDAILYAGRLLPLKGLTLALAALSKLPGRHLIVCGDGPDEWRLRRTAYSLGVGERVDFRGWLKREDLLAVMVEEASVLVFPSLHDEAGWVVVEALAAGLPVVCLDHGGPPLLAGPAGVAVGVAASPGRVADALAAALDDEALPSRALARARAAAFSPSARAADVRAVLEQSGLLPASSDSPIQEATP